MSKNQANLSSTRREDWETPDDLFEKLNSVFDFQIDLCASCHNSKTPAYLSEADDIMSAFASQCVNGIMMPGGYAWINPPYQLKGGTAKFVQRAIDLVGDNGLVCLIPAAVGNKWWKEVVWPNFDAMIFPRRFSFRGIKGSAMFDCAICIKWCKGTDPLVEWGFNVYSKLTDIGALVNIA